MTPEEQQKLDERIVRYFRYEKNNSIPAMAEYFNVSPDYIKKVMNHYEDAQRERFRKANGF